MNSIISKPFPSQDELLHRPPEPRPGPGRHGVPDGRLGGMRRSADHRWVGVNDKKIVGFRVTLLLCNVHQIGPH